MGTGNGCKFGIVKTAHKSKLGEVQRMSYQMSNSLSIDIMDSVFDKSRKYTEQLKTNDLVFIDYLRKNSNFSNDYDALIALYEQNNDFARSEYFRTRRYEIIKCYIKDLKTGHIIQNADNLVIVGSPYAMLLASINEDIYNDPTFKQENGCIQCWTSRFKNDEYLAEFRSPFNSQNNLGYVHNVYHEYFDRYFDLGCQIIAINMIGTDFQDRNNGSDQDSDSLYVTNQPDIVKHAKWCYVNYPTIVNKIPMESNHYNNTAKNFALIDNKLAAAQMDIGESSNLAQICLTYTYNFDGDIYKNNVAILAVLAQAAIDNAKRTFDVNITGEIKRIKKEVDVDNNGYPSFWLGIRKDFNCKRINKDLKCPMNEIYNMTFERYKSTDATLPMSYFFYKSEVPANRKLSRKIEAMIEKYRIKLDRYYISEENNYDEYILLWNNFEELINDIRMTTMPDKYIDIFSWLINRAFIITPNMQRDKNQLKYKLSKNKSLLLKVLYEINPDALLKCFSKTA